METLFWTFQSAPLTFKIRSRSPKSNKLFPSSQQCIYATLVKFHKLIQKIMHGNEKADADGIRTKNNISPHPTLHSFLPCIFEFTSQLKILICMNIIYLHLSLPSSSVTQKSICTIRLEPLRYYFYFSSGSHSVQQRVEPFGIFWYSIQGTLVCNYLECRRCC